MAENALRASLTRIGFSAAAARQITEVQNLNELEEIKLLQDDDVSNLCKALRRPGGMIPNPHPEDPNEVNMIINPGVVVPMRAQTNLQLAAFFLRHQDRISRPVTAAGITTATVRAMRPLKEHESAKREAADVPKLNEKDMVKTFDAIDSYLRITLGETKIPLGYVTREEAGVEASADDPATNYQTIDMEMIARAPHETDDNTPHPTFTVDNFKVWEILHEICLDNNAWTWIKSFSRNRNGRAAYQALHSHYLGISKSDNIQAEAENKLKNTFYSGERRNWNFERYVQIHKDQHTAIEGLFQYGYPSLDERSKVRHLMAGVRTNELDTVKAQVWSSVALRGDFDACVDLFKTFIQQKASNTTKTLNISNTSTERGGRGGGGRGGRGGDSRNTRRDSNRPFAGRGGRGRGRGRGGGGRGRGNPGRHNSHGNNKGEITDRYYTPEEFEGLGHDGRNRVYELREKRDAARNVNTSGLSSEDITRIVAAMNQTAAPTAPTVPATPAATGNRAHPALT